VCVCVCVCVCERETALVSVFTAFNKQNEIRQLVTNKFGRVWKEVAVT